MEPESPAVAPRYVIGESPVDDMDTAVRREIDAGVAPLVLECDSKLAGRRNILMEKWALVHTRMRCEDAGAEFVRVPDGGKYDALYRPASATGSDLWLAVQMKTTARLAHVPYIHDNNGKAYVKYQWTFRDLHNGPSVHILYVLEEQKLWIVPSAVCYRNSGTLTITRAKTQTQAHSVERDFAVYLLTHLSEIPAKLQHFYDQRANYQSINLLPAAGLSLSSSHTTNVSNAAKKRRNDYFALIGLVVHDAPAENWGHYSFIINGKKILDRNAYVQYDPYYSIQLGRHLNDYNQSTTVPHSAGDFDYMFVHLPPPHDRCFYLIPAVELARTGHLRTADSDGRVGLTICQPSLKRKNAMSENAMNDAVFNCNY